MTDKQVNLHPKNDSGTNLKPNIITENIPDKAVTMEKLDQNLQETIRIHGVHIDNNRMDINANTDEIEKMQNSLNTGTFDPTSDNPAGQKSIAGAMEKLNQNLQNTISVNTSSIATNRADISKNTSDIALLTSKDVAENKNVLIRLECREDGLYVVGTDI